MRKYEECKVKNLYMKAWAKANGIKNGDEWATWQYINWITDKHEEFRNKSGMLGAEKDYPEKFVRWLNE